MTLFADLALARRLERAEAEANARFVEARAALFPETGAAWIDVAGTYAMFDGVESPCTQTFGLGVFQPPTAEHLETIERFFRERHAPAFHEVSPLADAATVPLLNARGYHPVELSSVLFCPVADVLTRLPADAGAVRVRRVDAGEQGRWAETAAAGWADSAPPGIMNDLMKVSAARVGVESFLAELDGEPVAAGALSITGAVALLAGASTIPAARKRGAQLALLGARLRHAAQRGCEIAMMCALPGSGSQRNAERNGFRVAYTRIKWQLDRAAETVRPRPKGRRPR